METAYLRNIATLLPSAVTLYHPVPLARPRSVTSSKARTGVADGARFLPVRPFSNAQDRNRTGLTRHSGVTHRETESRERRSGCPDPQRVPHVLIDFQYAARTLRRNAAFAAAAVGALSLGIAANTAIFSVVNKVLLEPLPYPHPEQLVQIVTTSPLGNQKVVSIPKYDVWRDHTWAFQSMAAYDTTGPAVNLTEGEFPLPLEAERVSADYFRLFGAALVVGRAFSEEENRPGRRPVAVIGERLWRNHFKASQALIGNTILLDHQPCKVIGVLASGFAAERPIDVWLPLEAGVAVPDHIGRVRVVARLRPGVTVEKGAEQVAATMQWFRSRYPFAPVLYREEFTAISLRDALVGDVRPALLLLEGAVGFVLLVACANAGALALARASRRSPEIALRSALGASRTQLIRQLLTESILMAFGSGVIGLLLGFGGIRGLLALSPVDLPRAGANGSAIGLDWRVFLFTLVVSVFSGILFGLLPAMSASRADVMSLVKDTPVQSGMGFRRGGGRSVLVISQVALALVPLVGAGLLIRTFAATRTVDPGFDEDHVLTAEMALSGSGFERTAEVAGFVRRVERRMKQTRGVSAVAATSALPLEPALMMPFTIPRHDQRQVGRYHGVAGWRSVSPAYFDALRIRMLLGRPFSEGDDENSGPVVLINRAMLRKFWQEVDANPIGEFLIIGKGMGAGLEDIPRQIVGVVADIREAGLDREPAMYVPVAQLTDGMTARNRRVLPITWVIRTAGDRVSQGAVEQDLREGICSILRGDQGDSQDAPSFRSFARC